MQFISNSFVFCSLLGSVLFAADDIGKQRTQSEQLLQEESVNLLIINDFIESHTFMNVALTNLLEGLFLNMLVLCTKKNWQALQANASYVHQGMQTENSIFFKMFSLLIKFNGVTGLSQEDRDFYSGVSKDERRKFLFYLYFSLIKDSNKYYCKVVSDDYLLFIPKQKLFDKYGSDIRKNFSVRDNQYFNLDNEVGLLVGHLKDYDYIFMPSRYFFEKLNPTDRILYENLSKKEFNWWLDQQACYQNAADLLEQDNVGEELLKALFRIKPKNKYARSFNIFLMGHGKKDDIAELSIKSENKDLNDFVRVLLSFQENFLMKTLSVVSCFLGGQKVVDAFKVENYYSNSVLERISYPIINHGIFYTETYGWSVAGLFSSKDYFSYGIYNKFVPKTSDFFMKYFKALDAIPSDYDTVAKSILFNNTLWLQSLDNIANLIQIKFPNVAWMTPQIFDKKIEKITQVQALTQSKDIVVKSDTELIFLSANYVPRKIVIKKSQSRFMVTFLPVNYMNQNYVIDELIIKQDMNINQCMQYFLALAHASERINIIIKKLIIGTKKYDNVYVFIHRPTQFKQHGNVVELLGSGFFYELQGEMRQYSFAFDSDPFALKHLHIDILRDNEQREILQEMDYVQRKAKEGLKQSLIEFELNVAKRQVSPMPKMVVQSQLKREIQDKLLHIFDIIDVLDHKKS